MANRRQNYKAAAIPLIALCTVLVFLLVYVYPVVAQSRQSPAKTESTNTKPPSQQKKNTSVVAPVDSYSSYQSSVLPLLEKYCYDCHMDGSDEGDLDLDIFTSFQSMVGNRETWKDIKDHMNWKLMPPLKKEQPTQAERDAISQWIDSHIFKVDPNKSDPGPINARRLNRVEYANTMKDLFFISLDLENTLPADDSGDGFDNNASSLTIAPAHVEKYLIATEKALALAFPVDPPSSDPLSVDLSNIRGNQNKHIYFPFYSNQSISVLPKEISKQAYHVDIAASQHATGNENAKLDITHNGKKIKTLDVAPKFPAHKTYRISNIELKPGDSFTIKFTNDKYIPESKSDRNAFVHSVDFIPVKTTFNRLQTTFQKKYNILQKERESDRSFATRVLTEFSRHALRGNLHQNQIRPYLHFLNVAKKEKTSVYHGIRLAMQAMLLSPKFLFIDTPLRYKFYSSAPSTNKHLVSEYTLATRLAYFIWSSTPDKTLLDLAEQGKLRNNLTAQVNRMLNSPKAESLIKNFAGQWLQTRDLQIKSPDPTTFPNINQDDLTDMNKETTHMLRHILLKNKPITDIIIGDYSFINENLAAHYGITGVKGNYFRKVSLKNTPRRGILTHASVLMITSTPTRTSPVLRGKWLLENILGTSPPPPPPEVDSFEDTKSDKPLSLREELEKHRSKSECAACHKMMDPIGFAFESYNAVGKYRQLKEFKTKGELFSGEPFKNVLDLQNVIATQKADQFAATLSKKLLTYALARELEYFDKTAIELVVKQLKKNQYKFHTAIHTVIRTPAFQHYRTKP